MWIRAECQMDTQWAGHPLWTGCTNWHPLRCRDTPCVSLVSWNTWKLKRQKICYTMLQKFSKCEVKVHNTRIYLPLNFTWNQFWQIWISKIAIFTISDTLNSEFWSIWELRNGSILLRFFTSEPLKVPKMTFSDRLNSPKFNFT